MQNRTPSRPDALPDFAPVPRKYRHDGWTPERQHAFIEALADTGSVKHAARRINMSPEGAYYLRRQPGAEEFAAAWARALDHGVQRLEDIALDRAINGVEVPVYSYGKLVGSRIVHNDRLLMFILRNRAADRFAAGASGKRLDRPTEPERPDMEAAREQLNQMLDRLREEENKPGYIEYEQWLEASYDGRAVILPKRREDGGDGDLAPEDTLPPPEPL
jgi:hypothetical protein